MMCEHRVGKIDEAALGLVLNGPDDPAAETAPYRVLSSFFEYRSRHWSFYGDEPETFFGNLVWLDCGSFLCRGSREQMRRFLEWDGDEEALRQLDALPEGGDYGFVFIEDY